MSANPDRVPLDFEARAHRRWLITLMITVMFGGFGAVMAYLSYANSMRPVASSPGRSRSTSRPSSPTPGKASTPAPAEAPPPTVTPPAAAPGAPAPGDNGKGKDNGE